MTPYFRVFCTPVDLVTELVHVDDSRTRELLLNPPQTRHAGWTIWGADEIIASQEGLEAVGVHGRRLFLLKNGHIEYWEPCRSETFQWAQSDQERALHPWLYDYAVTELTVNFTRLASLIYKHLHLSTDVVFGVALYSIQGFILMPYGPRTLEFHSPSESSSIKPYTKQDLRIPPVRTSIPFEPDRAAFEMVKSVYNAFGFAEGNMRLFDSECRFQP